MPTVAEHMAFAYPFLLDPGDERYVADEVLDWALAVAVGFRPSCLPEELQNLAQAHYAAYLISARTAAPGVFGSVSNAASQQVAGPIVERQEGQLRVRYGTGGSGTAASNTTAVRGDPGPSAPYAAWAALAAMCGPVPGLDPAASAEMPTGGIVVRSNPRAVW